MAGGLSSGRGTHPIYTGGFSAAKKSSGGSRGGGLSWGYGKPKSKQRYIPQRQSSSVSATHRLQSNAPRSTAAPATRRRSTAPEDIYKVFPEDTGRNDVKFQDRFRTGPEAAKTPTYSEHLSSGRTQEVIPQRPEQYAPQPAQTQGPAATPQAPPADRVRQPMPTKPQQPAGEKPPEALPMPERPSYLDRPELPDYAEQFKEYKAETREVQPMETMQGQIKHIMDEGNPLMDLMRTRADQQMAARGLYHSTSGIEAAERAMLDSILPIASQDAATYSNQARINQEFLQNASNMNVETFNNEIAQVANQGRQMQLMSYEADIRERLAAVDQRYAMQLETLTQEYKILGEKYRSAGSLYSDTLKSMASILGNNALTPEQQKAGVESLVGQLEAGLQFVTGVSGGTGTDARPTVMSGATPEAGMALMTQEGAPVAGISGQRTLGVYEGGEIEPRGKPDSPEIRRITAMGALEKADAPGAEILRIDQGSGFPTLMKVGNWYYRPTNWNEDSGMRNVQIAQGARGVNYLEMMPMKEPEQQRQDERFARYRRENPGATGGRLGARMAFATPPNLFVRV